MKEKYLSCKKAPGCWGLNFLHSRTVVAAMHAESASLSRRAKMLTRSKFVFGSVAPWQQFLYASGTGVVAMRRFHPLALILIVLTLVLLPDWTYAEDQNSAQAPLVLGPYKPVPIILPESLNDPEFVSFRKQLAEIAQKKDRAALAALVAASFFWVPEDTDIADKKASAIDNLSRALGLDSKDALGWDALAAYAAELGAMADPQRKGVFCAPPEPAFDERAADELAAQTQTDATDWAFPLRDGIEVRSAPNAEASVIDTLGLYLVRVLADDSPANAVYAAFHKVLTPSAKIGYVSIELVLPIGGEQLCYIKEASGWKIAGFMGGEPNQ
jgi:hypothetical protein